MESRSYKYAKDKRSSMRALKRLVRKIFNLAGLHVVRMNKNPKHSLLGLRHLPIKTIIDIGANEGQFAKFISPFFPGAYIFCFEPLQEPYEQLTKWAERQGKGNVEAFNLALGESEGIHEMFSHIHHSPSSSFLKTTNDCERLYPFTQKQVVVPVKATTLGSWVKSLPAPLSPEILIKLDVQGYEDRVIRGGQELFKMAKACILEICLDRLYDQQTTFRDVLNLLDGLGYSYAGNLEQTYGDDGHVIFTDAVFLKSE
jgi:FkbM family methyltransferase